MHNFTKISDLTGIATISRKGGDSPLCVGDLATERPFEDFCKVSPVGLGIKVSDAKFEKAARKQNHNQTSVHTKTLLKHINPDMFYSGLSPRTVEEVTGKKGQWDKKLGKMVFPKLTEEEQAWCHCAEWSHDTFGTLKGVTVTISTVTGWVFTKKF